MDAETLCTITENVEREVLVLALLGAPGQLTERILRQMPRVQAAAIRKEIDCIGPVRLSDVEEARRRTAETAAQLHARGKIDLAESNSNSLIGRNRIKTQNAQESRI